jgi:hypothetical protein
VRTVGVVIALDTIAITRDIHHYKVRDGNCTMQATCLAPGLLAIAQLRDDLVLAVELPLQGLREQEIVVAICPWYGAGGESRFRQRRVEE